MPTPQKPCDGFFSQETINLLTANRDHAQWLLHPCDRCGQQVGARIDKGRWVPENHWPSIPPRPHRDLPNGSNLRNRDRAELQETIDR